MTDPLSTVEQQAERIRVLTEERDEAFRLSRLTSSADEVRDAIALRTRAETAEAKVRELEAELAELRAAKAQP